MTSEDIQKVIGRITAGLTELSERALSLLGALKDAKEISADQLKELSDLGKLVSELTQRYPSPKAGVEKSAEAEFVPKAIRERYNAIDGRLAAARQNGTTTTSQATGATDPAAGTQAAATGTQQTTTAATQTPPPAAATVTETPGSDQDDKEIDWAYDMAATFAEKNPQTPAQALTTTKPETDTSKNTPESK